MIYWIWTIPMNLECAIRDGNAKALLCTFRMLEENLPKLMNLVIMSLRIRVELNVN